MLTITFQNESRWRGNSRGPALRGAGKTDQRSTAQAPPLPTSSSSSDEGRRRVTAAQSCHDGQGKRTSAVLDHQLLCG